MKLMNIASGSQGNCTFVGTEKTAFLVDSGISMKKTEEGLNSVNLSLKDIDGIFITHEHIDHVKSLGTIMRKYGTPVYLTEKTRDAVLSMTSLGKMDTSLLKIIDNRNTFKIKDMDISTHPISHDAADPVCYSFSDGKSKAALATDLGCYDDDMISFLSDHDSLLIEANHDIRMLEAGPYPYQLKKRILGDKGHLSNESSGLLIRELLNDHIKNIILGHLSHENNFIELAYETVKEELKGNPYTDDVRDFNLNVARRDMCSAMAEF